MKPGSYVALMPRERAAYDDLLVRKARLETELSDVRLTLRRIRQKANERVRYRAAMTATEARHHTA